MKISIEEMWDKFTEDLPIQLESQEYISCKKMFFIGAGSVLIEIRRILRECEVSQEDPDSTAVGIFDWMTDLLHEVSSHLQRATPQPVKQRNPKVDH